MTDEQRIEATVDEILRALETPIAGYQSVLVLNRTNAKRLLRATLQAIWEAVNKEQD